MENANTTLFKTDHYYKTMLESTKLRVEHDIEMAVKNVSYSAVTKLYGAVNLRFRIANELVYIYEEAGYNVEILDANRYIRISWEGHN